MASKINTNDPKHHKYVTVNKYERKKKKIIVIFNHINKIYNVFYQHITEWWLLMSYNSHWKHTDHPPYHGVKGCKIIYDDCNHTSYRVIKNGKFITEKHSFIPKTFYRKNVHRLW
jgi:hypothetical protein